MGERGGPGGEARRRRYDRDVPMAVDFTNRDRFRGTFVCANTITIIYITDQERRYDYNSFHKNYDRTDHRRRYEDRGDVNSKGDGNNVDGSNYKDACQVDSQGKSNAEDKTNNSDLNRLTQDIQGSASSNSDKNIIPNINNNSSGRNSNEDSNGYQASSTLPDKSYVKANKSLPDKTNVQASKSFPDKRNVKANNSLPNKNNGQASKSLSDKNSGLEDSYAQDISSNTIQDAQVIQNNALVMQTNEDGTIQVCIVQDKNIMLCNVSALLKL